MKLVKRFAVGAAVLFVASISAPAVAEAPTRADTPTVMRLGADLRAEKSQDDTQAAIPPVAPAPPAPIEWEGEAFATDNEERNAPSTVEAGDGKMVLRLPHILRALHGHPRATPDATRHPPKPKHSNGSGGSDSHDKDAGHAQQRPRGGKSLRGKD